MDYVLSGLPLVCYVEHNGAPGDSFLPRPGRQLHRPCLYIPKRHTRAYAPQRHELGRVGGERESGRGALKGGRKRRGVEPEVSTFLSEFFCSGNAYKSV